MGYKKLSLKSTHWVSLKSAIVGLKNTQKNPRIGAPEIILKNPSRGSQKYP